jgi:hypothetical protein
MKRKSKPSPESPDSRELIHAVIAAKAYDLWEHSGRPDNQAEAMWLEAERDLIATQSWNQSETLLPVSF